MVRSFAPKAATLAKEKDSVKLGVVVASLVTNPPSFQAAIKKLSALTVALRIGEFKINTKLYLLFKLMKCSEYSSQIEDVIIYFL